MSISGSTFSAPDTALGRRWLRCLFLAVSALLLLASSVADLGATTIYSTGFEANQGYNANLELVGQNGWRKLGSGGNGLLTGFFPGQGQPAYVGFDWPPGYIGRNDYLLRVYQPINKALQRVQFSVTMSVVDSSGTEPRDRDEFRWSVYNQEGDFLFRLGFDNRELGIYYYLDGTNSLSGEWADQYFENDFAYPLRVEIDFGSNRWSATLNGVLLATNQPITTIGSPLNLGHIDAEWFIWSTNAPPGNNYMVFDNYLITASLPSPRLSQLGFLGKAPVLRLTGTPNMAFAIEASTNLTQSQWRTLKTNVTTGGYFDYVGDSLAGFTRRFYRARWVP